MTHLDEDELRGAIARTWASDVVPSLCQLVSIPALSPSFDPSWATTGYLAAAVDHMTTWAGKRALDVTTRVVEFDGRSPVLLIEVPATDGAADRGTALIYGHLDKQPALGTWSPGLGPWQPVLRDGRLYGRGSADDGYAGYSAVSALEAVRAAGGEHPRTVILLETAEESGSPDLPAYLDHLAGWLGDVNLVICLDAGAGTDRERLWLTSSLRGAVQATVTVRVLEAGVHSGIASGIAPDSFRIMRTLLDRLEDPLTGRIKLAEMNVPIPADRQKDAVAFAALEPAAIGRGIPFVQGMSAASADPAELILNNTWRPTLTVTGADGLPESILAPAAVRPETSLRLSFRLPPTADSARAKDALVKAVTTDVPYGANVTVDNFVTLDGWNAPSPPPWLANVLDALTGPVFSQPYRQLGIGGSIPFMDMLGHRYPDAQLVATGAVGADSNMHVPDEWLDLKYAEQISAAVAYVLDAHARA